MACHRELNPKTCGLEMLCEDCAHGYISLQEFNNDELDTLRKSLIEREESLRKCDEIFTQTCAELAEVNTERDLAVKAVAESSVVESRLRAERDRLKRALEGIRKAHSDHHHDRHSDTQILNYMDNIARTALEASDEHKDT